MCEQDNRHRVSTSTRNHQNSYLPLRVYWDVTDKCPLNCVHCYLRNKNRIENKTLSFEILGSCLESGVLWFSFSGAEPLSCSYLEELVDAISSADCIYDIATSTVPLSRHHVSLFKKYPPRFIQVSIDGTESRHNKIRGGEYYSKVLNNIQLLKSLGIEIVVATTLLKGLSDDIDDLFAELNSLGIDAFRLRLFIPNVNKELMISRGEYRSFIRRVMNHRGKTKFNIMALPFEFCVSSNRQQEFTNPACGFCFNTISIDSLGNVIPCISLNRKVVLGNLAESSLKEIWSSTAMNEFREEFVILPEDCHKCEYLENCFGGCKACTYALFGRFDEKNPYCVK